MQTPTPSPTATVDPTTDIAYDGEALPDNPTGRVIVVKGKRYLLVDELTFARIEQAINRLKAADAYIKKLEAERAGVAAVFEMQKKLDAIDATIHQAKADLVAAKDEVIAASAKAFAASERENKALAEQNSDLKTKNSELKSKLNKSRLMTVLSAAGVVALLLLK